MLHWFRSLLNAKPRQESQPAARHEFERKLVPADAEHIRAALVELENVGLRFAPGVKEELHAKAMEIMAGWEGVSFAKEPTLGNWALIALAGTLDNSEDTRSPFQNALRFDDHCYNVASLEGYASMVSDIVELTGGEWAIESVEVKHAVRLKSPIRSNEPVSVTIKADPAVSPFELLHNKDFDWSIIHRLNERLPKDVSGRFAAFLDGDATIVFLTPENIQKLNSLCGHEFFYQE